MVHTFSSVLFVCLFVCFYIETVFYLWRSACMEEWMIVGFFADVSYFLLLQVGFFEHIYWYLIHRTLNIENFTKNTSHWTLHRELPKNNIYIHPYRSFSIWRVNPDSTSVIYWLDSKISLVGFKNMSPNTLRAICPGSTVKIRRWPIGIYLEQKVMKRLLCSGVIF